jgi:hypothetical protein
MKYVFGLIIFSVLMSSCTDQEEVILDNDQNADVEVTDKKLQVGDITHFETLFDEVEFASPLEFKLLKELQVCDSVEIEGSNCATCTPKYFKIHPFNNNAELSDAFMLQVKALTVMKGQEVPLPMRHLIVFERENGSLVKVNGFRGNLIATRESESGVKDLIIRFYIPDEGAFMNCLFLWKDGQYKFESVEAIDGAGGHGSVKASVKKEVSKEVYQTLMSNAMLF